MSTLVIDRLSPSSESLRKVPRRLRDALAKRAVRKQVAQVTEHIHELHDTSVATEITVQSELTTAMTKVHKIAELTRTSERDVAVTAKKALDDSAEHLFEGLKEVESQAGNKLDLGIAPVLDVLQAWDIARTDATHNLAAVALNHFHGLAQENLVAAFIAASKDSSSSFDDELDKINNPRKD